MPDVNVLVAAFREDDPRHAQMADWLERAVANEETLGLSDSVLSGFVRVVTHPRIFDPPTPLARAIEQVDVLRQAPGVQAVSPGPSFWTLFVSLCRESGITGAGVSDTAHAALALEHRATFVSLDRGFQRFPRLRWESPLTAGQASS